MRDVLPTDARLRRVWALYGVVALFHAVLDPAVTYVAVTRMDIGTEANPLLAPAFDTGLGAIIGYHLPLFGLLIVGLAGLTILFDRADATEAAQLYVASVVVLGLCLAWGVALVGWNLWVLVTGV